MPTLNLKNITIKKLEDRNFKPYYVIVNKEGWQDLVSNWENLKEVEIEFIENERDFKTYRKLLVFMLPMKEILSFREKLF